MVIRDTVAFQLLRVLLILTLLVLFGALGLQWIEGWGFLDSLYMAVITLSTVGFSEVHPLSDAGRWAIMLYMVVGLGTFLYGVSAMGEIMLRNELDFSLGRRRMQNTIKHLQDHIIICGYGRMGRPLAEGMRRHGKQLVIIEKDDELVQRAKQDRFLVIHGDGTEDENLQAAGVERASGLAAVLRTDTDNLYVVLSARLLNAKMRIFARATDESSIAKMQKAGADQVISPQIAGASRMTAMLANTQIQDLIEILHAEGQEIDMIQLSIDGEHPLRGKSLRELDLAERNIMPVGVRLASGKLSLPPSFSSPLETGDTLMALGKSQALQLWLDNVRS